MTYTIRTAPELLSGFLQRWLLADPERATQLAALRQASYDTATYQFYLEQELARHSSSDLAGATRRLRNRVLASLIQRDLLGEIDTHTVMQAISLLADFIVQTHLAALEREMHALYGLPLGEESGKAQSLIVLGMGKLGGYELNVSSDIDLIFCYAEDGETQAQEAGQRSLSNHEFFSRLGKKLIAAIAEVSEHGFCFRVDMALRPNGNSGPLVASLAMVEEYFLVQGREWERYAWVKARAITGQAEDIAALEKIVFPFVYRRYLDFGAIDSLRAMHSQIRAEVIRQEHKYPERSHNVKLGRGGIREVEFLAQVFQLIRGGREADLRDRSTRNTLNTLAEKNILEASVVEGLQAAYIFLRDLEHRLQYLNDAQTHIFPSQPEDQLKIAQMMGLADVAALHAALAPHKQFVAAQFDAIFKDKGSDQHSDDGLLACLQADDQHDAVYGWFGEAGFSSADSRALQQRLCASWASSKLQNMAESYRNKLIALLEAAARQLLLPLEQADQHSASWHRILDFMESIARRTAYLSLLTEFPHTLSRIVKMMRTSDWAAKFLARHPLLLDELLDTSALLARPDWPGFASEVAAELSAHQHDTERQLDILRESFHAMQFRLLAQDLEGKLSVEHLADELSLLADHMVALTLQAIWQNMPNRHREQPRFAVIAYGKLGGKELGYASDLDVIFLYDDDDQDAPPLYAKLAQRFITWMTSHTAAGILFDIDIALRPDGASGLLVSSVSAFERYQSQSAWLWEHQALSRARFCAGDAAIGERFEAIRASVLQQTRDAEKLKHEVLSMRQKMRAAHPPQGNLVDIKHAEGGMIDIEFIVQYLVLGHAHQYPQLCANKGNIALLGICAELGLLEPELAQRCAAAYRHLRKLQHALRLQGNEKARVEAEFVANDTAAIRQLWQQLLLTL